MVKSERDTFIEDNLRLVHSLCRRFAGKGIEYDDLYQAGCVGLVKAADAFDKERGLMFSTYAVPVILGEIRRLFRDGGSVKVSRSLKELSIKIARVKEKLENNLNREPTVSELAEELGVSPEEICESISACRPCVSLTVGDGDDDDSQLDIPDNDYEDNISNKILLDEAFKVLNETERNVISCRYYNYYTQSKTAQILGMSQVQVSRMEKKILNKLRGNIDIGA